MPRRRLQRDTLDPRIRLAREIRLEEGLEAIEIRLYHRYMLFLLPAMYLTYRLQAGFMNFIFLLMAHFGHWLGYEDVKRWDRQEKLGIIEVLLALYIISGASMVVVGLLEACGFELGWFFLHATPFSSLSLSFGFSSESPLSSFLKKETLSVCCWSMRKVKEAMRLRGEEEQPMDPEALYQRILNEALLVL
ncbi:hypothetical protein CAEBREN_13482 [Caenorhabditis brenneri]|uniref:Uncharacterized protein n=1 Tax=Caenorhabditis brenneri TaxID=135651 RepID=G0MFZ4_CAEBE|nr:hypothetical protein CAEBREN_13482 [Caenorhabditis brenneri]